MEVHRLQRGSPPRAASADPGGNMTQLLAKQRAVVNTASRANIKQTCPLDLCNAPSAPLARSAPGALLYPITSCASPPTTAAALGFPPATAPASAMRVTTALPLVLPRVRVMVDAPRAGTVNRVSSPKSAATLASFAPLGPALLRPWLTIITARPPLLSQISGRGKICAQMDTSVKAEFAPYASRESIANTAS